MIRTVTHISMKESDNHTNDYLQLHFHHCPSNFEMVACRGKQLKGNHFILVLRCLSKRH